MNDTGLRSFQDLNIYKHKNDHPSPFFLYLQLRSAIQAASILSDRQPITHPIIDFIKKSSISIN